MARKIDGPIAIFLSALSGGGAERAMVNLANRLVELDIETHMVLGRREGPYLELLDPRVEIVDLGVHRMLQSLLPLNAYMRSARPAVLMPALAHTHVIAVIGRLLFRWPVRLVLSVQNTAMSSAGSKGSWMQRNRKRLVRLLYGYADHRIAISQGVADEVRLLVGARADPITVIHNPVVTPTFYEQLKAEPEHPWFQDKSVPLLLAVGRLNLQKDYPTMLAAFARLRAGRPARLMILGKGEMQAELENLTRKLGIDRDVHFAGFVGNPYACMREARLFVLSSQWEGLANVIAEALACGTPVVSTDCPSGPAEILNNGEFGWLAPVSDVEALARAMGQALDTPPDRARLKARGGDFDVESTADRYLDILVPQTGSGK